jgi:exodeoxyribonuclease VII small subunit
MSNNHTNMNYDEAFAALEEVLRSLESGELPLEQALALYEDGVALATLCSQKLEDAELRVRQWQGTSNGGFDPPVEATRPFDGWQDK